MWNYDENYDVKGCYYGNLMTGIGKSCIINLSNADAMTCKTSCENKAIAVHYIGSL